ncbi:MAG: GNAT family N-acetyltransferase [Nitrospirae bacterium]|nr:GNAT family N-acetyltransferase [Nitrospirota bacterium]
MLFNGAYQGRFIVYLLYKNDELVLIAPMQKSRNGPVYDLTFMGHDTHADYLDFIYEEINKSDLEYFLKYLQKQHRCSTVKLSFINEASRTVEVLSRLSLQVAHETERCASIRLPLTREMYLDCLGSSTKREIRAGNNKLRRNFDVQYYTSVFGEKLDDKLVEKLLGLYADRVSEKAGSFRFDSNYMLFLKNYICQHENAFAHVLYLDANVAAFNIGFYDRQGMATVLLVSMDSRYRAFNAGNMLLYHAVSSLIEMKHDGVYDAACYDLTRGDELYKFKYGGRLHYNHTYVYSYSKLLYRMRMKMGMA